MIWSIFCSALSFVYNCVSSLQCLDLVYDFVFFCNALSLVCDSVSCFAVPCLFDLILYVPVNNL